MRRLIIVISSVFVFLILLIALAPTILSTSLGISLLSKLTKNELQVSSLSLNWLGGQEAHGIKYKEFTAKEVKTDASLWKLLWTREIGNLEVIDPKGIIETGESATPSKQKKKKTTIIPFTGHLIIQNGDVVINHPLTQSIRFEKVFIDIKIPEGFSPIAFSLKGNTQQDGVLGQFNLFGQVNPFKEEIVVEGKIDNFPTRSLDRNGILSECIGSSFNAQINAKLTNENPLLQIKASSSQLQANIEAIPNNGALVLKQPATLTVALTPACQKKLFNAPTQKQALFKLTLQSMNLPLKDPLKTTCAGVASLDSDLLKIPQLNFSFDQALRLTQPASFIYTPENLQGVVQSAEIPIPQIEKTKAQLTFQTNQGITGEIKLDSFQNIDILAKQKSAQLHAVASLNRDRLSFNKPIKVDGTISNDILPATFPLLFKPTAFSLRIDPFSISIKEPILPQLKIKGEGALAETAVANRAKTNQIVLKPLSGKFQLDAKKEMALISLTSKDLDLNMSLDHVLFQNSIDTSQATVSCTLDLHQFPTEILSATTIGSTLDLHLKALSSPKSQTLSVNAKSQHLNLQAAFNVNDGFITLANQNASADLTLTKEGFAFLKECFQNSRSPFELDQDSHLNVVLSSFKWPILINPTPKTFLERLPVFQGSFADIRMQGKLAIDTFALREKQSGRIAYLNTMKGTFNKSDKENISFNLEGQVASKGGKIPVGQTAATTKEGKFTADGKLEHLFTDTPLSATVNANFQNFPSLLLDVFNTKNHFSNLFGPSFNATLKTNIQSHNGPFNLTIQSAFTRASINGSLRNGVLFLSEPIYAQMNLTPGMSNLFSLKEIASKNPITLQIDSKDFSFPLFPYNLNLANIPKMRLELGQISCKNEGNLNIALGLLKSRSANSRDLHLWFAPIDMRMKNGILDVERTEILVADTFDVAMWGKVDFNRNYVDMVLGLTANCLEEAFGFKDLPQNYVLQVPVKGPMERVEINKAAATAKIAALFAWQQNVLGGLIDKDGKGGVGSLFGELLGRFATLPDFDSPVPPAKHPFPWETAQPKPKQEPRRKKTKVNPNEKPIKQLLKMLKPI